MREVRAQRERYEDMMEAVIYAAAAALFVVLLFLPGRTRDADTDWNQLD